MRIAKFLAPVAVLSLVVMGAAFVGAQEPKLTLDDTPKAVKKAVKTAYPDAKINNVLKEKNEKGATVFEIEMTVKSKGVDIMVDSEGTIYTIEEEIEFDDLPKAAQASTTKAYPKGKVTKVEKVTDEDKKVTYEVFVKIGDKAPFEVLMDKSGKIIKDGSKPEPKEKKEKEEDDEKETKAEKKKPKN